ncbi:MAG: YdcF family protein [Lachnospiraceae bacterium]|uniref:YdcF family protein n=1 Tax=Candidatus Merdisoma sp. JLR.KK006 TaxID=3112626 RepID=UPI002FEFFBEB|nr:YdcF family protein [Lachnospiraceae bacterium]
MGMVFLICGVLCVLYYVGIVLYAGIRASFAWFWLLLGGAFFLAGAVCRISALQAAFGRIPVGVKLLGGIFLAIGLAAFLFLEGCIISGMAGSPKEPAEYIIVLGAQVKGTTVSKALHQRLSRAAEYLQEHKDTIVIVSGGQGSGEDIPEAEAMKTWLMEQGIARERILEEDKSVNTNQNIRFSRELLEDKEAVVGIVSNDFHVFRAVHIAKAQGLDAVPIPAPSSLGMYPHYMVREAFAVVKDLAAGNMVF